MKIPKQKITLDEVYEMFEDGQLYDECTMVNREYGKCHDYPCDDCVGRTKKEINDGTFEI